MNIDKLETISEDMLDGVSGGHGRGGREGGGGLVGGALHLVGDVVGGAVHLVGEVVGGLFGLLFGHRH
jgi:hypothetical protein